MLKLSKAYSIRGAEMGRPTILPFVVMGTNAEPVKLHLERLRWVDGDYDQGGAYWGHSNNPKEEASKNVYCAWGKFGPNDLYVQVFVRAKSRKSAKVLVRDHIPKAKFFH